VASSASESLVGTVVPINPSGQQALQPNCGESGADTFAEVGLRPSVPRVCYCSHEGVGFTPTVQLVVPILLSRRARCDGGGRPSGNRPSRGHGWAKDRLTLSLDEISQTIKEEKTTSFPGQGPKIDSSPLIEGRGVDRGSGGNQTSRARKSLATHGWLLTRYSGSSSSTNLPDVLIVCHRLSLASWCGVVGVVG
jgi:hypothetical protein